MKASVEGVHWDKRIQKNKKRVKAGIRFTSVHLLILAFVFMIAFGGIMKMITS